MDVSTEWFHKFTKFHTFKQARTNDGQKYYFSVNLKKWYLFLASSAILALGYILELTIFNLISGNRMLGESLAFFVLRRWVQSLLGVLFFVRLAHTVFLIVIIPRMIKLKKFTLTLKEGEVLVCEKSLPISKKLVIHIIARYSSLQDSTMRQDLDTTLMFEPLNLSPFSQLSKVEKYLSYHEKRRLAEQLSLNLKIQLADMLSSFEPGIYESKQTLAEKLKFTEPLGNVNLTQSKSVHSVQLPYDKMYIFYKVGFFIFFILFIFLLGFTFFHPLSTSEPRATSFDFIFLAVIFVIIIAIFLLVLLRTPIRNKIVVSDDSISLISQNIWGARRIFHSSFNEFKDISVVPSLRKTRIVFRSDKLTGITIRNSKEVLTKATITINNLLANRL